MNYIHRAYLCVLPILFIYPVVAQNSNVTAQSECETGDYFFAQYQFDKALVQYDSCYHFEQNNTKYLFKKAACASQLGLFSQTKNTYLKLLEIDSVHLGALNKLAQVYLKLGDVASAVNCNDKLIKLDSMNAYYYKRKAELLLTVGDVQQSVENFERAHTINPKDIEVLISLSSIYEEIQLYSPAVNYIDKAYALDSNNIRVLKQKARIAYKEKQYDAVISDVEALLSLSVDTSYYHLKLLGISLFQTKEFERAAQILELVVEAGYETEVVHYYWGQTHKAIGNYKESEQCFEKAIDLGVSKNIASYYTNLAVLYEEQGRHAESIATYQASYKHSKDDVLLYHLARNYDLYYKDKSTALRYFERYLNANDSGNISYMDYSKYRVSELRKVIHFDVDSLE